MGLHGPDVSGNKVWVCPTGHTNIHRLIAELTKVDGDWTQVDDRRWHPNERALAKQGFDEWVAAGKPGTPEAIARGGAAVD